jgi:peptidoglycan/LPS O-acetylase OafA/YrhL
MDLPHLKNNFDFLRFTAAIFVVFGHSYALLNLMSAEPLQMVSGELYFGTLGVYIFFVMSGYLVLSSWEHHPSVMTFFINRILRIYPALIVIVCITALFLGPLVTTLSLREYFMNPDTWAYLKTITVFQIQYKLPGVFEQNFYQNIANGSLWSLPIEFSLYIFVSILGLVGIYRKKIAIAILFLVMVFGYLFFQDKIIYIVFPVIGAGLLYYISIVFFLAGMVFYLYRDKILLNWAILLCLLVFWIASFKTSFLIPISFFFIPYLVMYTAFFTNKKMNSFGKNRDLSYGIYIIAFPIQQTIIYLFDNRINPLLLFILAIAVCIPLAALSWHLIERPALSLKVP